MSEKLGIIGDPIGHSLSPYMHSAALAALGLDYTYTAFNVKPAHLKAAVAGLAALGFSGFNVTIPHKVAIMEYLTDIDESAAAIGAVNTVLIDRSEMKLTGYNTDHVGFISPLIAAGIDLRAKTAVVLGAGGAARAVVWGLVKSGVGRIAVAARDISKAAELCDRFKARAELEPVAWRGEQLANPLAAAALVVNTTPLGMYPRVDGCPAICWEQVNRQALIYDLIYTPETTKFLRLAQENGHCVFNGEMMLVEQGVAALKLWTGRGDISGTAMREALRRQLAVKSQRDT